MKIERLSENQIRCTLNKTDLNEKQLKISELAYGSPKAKELFKDMMQQASVELGFEVDDTPLMIEAIPVSSDCLILIVTKVEDPEELDTRFSRFSKVNEYDLDDEDDDDEYLEQDDLDEDDEDSDDSDEGNGTIAKLEISGSGAVPQGVRDMLEGLFSTISGLASSAGDFAEASAANDSKDSGQANSSTSAAADKNNKKSDMKETKNTQKRMYSLYTFDSLPTIITASRQVASFYFSENCLYKNPSDNRYYLLLSNSNNTVPEFTRACNILAEYGTYQKLTYAMPAHFKEHFTVIMGEDALQTMSAL